MGLISRVSRRTYRNMGLLADNQRKQKWSLDPWNLNWKKESQQEGTKNIGAKLMRKLGWSDGDGLGKNRQGRKDHITAKVKNNNRGVGCSLKHNKEWVAGQDDFNAVLRMLNDDDTSAFKENKRAQKRAIQRKAMHSKFVKAKDLSSSKKSDIQALFGSAGNDIFSQLKASSTPAKKPADSSDSDSSEDEGETKPKKEPTVMDVEKSAMANTSTSALSCSDYFANKLKLRRANNPGLKLVNPYNDKPLEKRRSGMDVDLKELNEAVIKAEAEQDEAEATKKKKKSKKKSKQVEEEVVEEEAEPEKKKKKKKKRSKEVEEEVVEEEAEPEKKKKKK